MNKLAVEFFAEACYNKGKEIIHLETEAKLCVQELIRLGVLELAWSFVLDYENGNNPFGEVRQRIAAWKNLAYADCGLSEEIAEKAAALMGIGLKQVDAAHVACAIQLGADYFLTTDKKVLNKPITEITVINPLDSVRRHPSAEQHGIEE